MTDRAQQALFSAIYKLCKPLVRILLRNGIPFSGFSEIMKRAYLDVAANEFGVPGRKQSDSRVATLTGLTRKEVHRIKTLEVLGESELPARYNRAARVVYGWVHDTAYHDPQGNSLDLPFDTGSPCFAELVKSYSGDVPSRAILDELAQVGVVEKMDNGLIRLLERAYIPSKNEMEKLSILGTDVSGLIQTIDRNIYQKDVKPYFQRKVYYDNLPQEALDEIRKAVEEKAQTLLENMDQTFAVHDRDIHPEVKGTGRKAAGISVFYFENDVDVEEPRK